VNALTFRRVGFAVAVLFLAVVGYARADVFNMPSGETSLQFVTVGDPGNAADTTSYGSVGYTYQMGKYDVTLAQYTAFLNAVAATDTYGLYNSGMSTYFSTQGISQTGSPGRYSYSVTGSNPQAANCPIFDVTWGDAARFCNWLQNGQPTSGTEGTGTTETGAYTLNGATSDVALMAVRSPSHSGAGAAAYFIPSENDWYKAAYYKSGGTNARYWMFATQSDTPPNNSLALAPTSTNDANYYNGGYIDPTNYLTPVGTFAASPGPYGTYDMGGDVWQWNETDISGSFRGGRGGSWYNGSPLFLASAYRGGGNPADGNGYGGFRVASSAAVPEPASIALLLAGALGLLAYAWRRRQAA